MKKVFKAWVSKQAKANEIIRLNGDSFERGCGFWSINTNKKDCTFDNDHWPPKRVTFTVEVED